jgi:general L-amino acid transport system permease protein
MASANNEVAFVRTADAPVLPPPPNAIGVNGWLLQNLVSSWWVALLAGLFALLAGTLIWDVIKWAIIDSVWVAENREGCLAPLAEGKPLGACWAYVKAKLPQWIYGTYPIDLRWRPATVLLLFFALLIPLLIPRVPYKGLNAGLLFIAFPIVSFYLLYGTPIPHAGLGFAVWLVSTLFWFAGSLVAAIGFIFDSVLAFLNAGTAFSTVMSYVAFPFRWISEALDALLGFAAARLGIPAVFWLDYLLTSALVLGFLAARPAAQTPGWRGSLVKGAVAIVAIGVFIRLVNIDEGLVLVDTGEWGGLLVTLIVAVTGIVASLPIGIMLALGRRSKMPAVRLLSVAFIELVRGVPLLTVLFMASVMLPLFLPAGTNFNKLLRALIGVALFSSAYMAEVVRGGLQAIPRGQYEAAQALGLSYWKMMVLIVLPQALRIVIPGIVNSFISLFKDTTLVSIVGIFDLLGIVQAGFVDQKWVSAATPPTGYFAVAAIYWAFCFSMSRYSLYMERRLATGYRR